MSDRLLHTTKWSIREEMTSQISIVVSRQFPELCIEIGKHSKISI